MRVVLWLAVPGEDLSTLHLGALTTATFLTAVLSVILAGEE
jgi:hypothetical protein